MAKLLAVGSLRRLRHYAGTGLLAPLDPDIPQRKRPPGWQNRGVKNVGAFRWGEVWIPPTVTRDNVYYCERGTTGWREPFQYATVFQRGRNGRIVAHNDLPRTVDTPLVPDGDELFARPDAGLICIGYTVRTGERYEAMGNARRILEDIPPLPSAETGDKAADPHRSRVQRVRGAACRDQPYSTRQG